MKIIFIGKNASKPKSISLSFFIILLFFLLGANFFLLEKYLVIEKIGNDVEDQYIDLDSIHNNLPDNADLFVKQIGELNTRIMQIDLQTERLQDVMKKQMIGKEKVPKLKKK